MFISLSTDASVYSYADSVKAVGLYYNFHIIVEWDTSDATANPCLVSPTKWRVTKCELRVQIAASGSTFIYPSLNSVTSDCMIQVNTLGELGTCLSGSTYIASAGIANVVLGEKTSFNFLSEYFKEGSNPCVSIFYRTITFGGGGDSWTTLPNQVCGLMPPPIGVCSTPDSIEFDHGTVNTNFDTSELVKSFNIECNMDLSAGITLSMLDNSSRMKLGDNLYSTLMINDAVISNANKMNLKTGANNFKMTSRLSKTGEIKNGDYSGQTVMILFMD